MYWPTIINADLFDAFEDKIEGVNDIVAIMHVCNCQGVMGSGIAAGIKEKYPAAHEAYIKFGRKNHLTLGTVSFASIKINGTDKYIFNLHAQDWYGYGERHLNYEALYQTLEKAAATCSLQGLKGSIAVPFKMGSDRAGGDWNIVKAMLDSVLDKSEYNLYCCKL